MSRVNGHGPQPERGPAPIAGVPDPSMEALAVSVHMFNEMFWGLAFATTDAERLELLRQMSGLGSQMLFEMVPLTSRVQARFRAAGARARAARSAPGPSQHPDRGPGGAP